MEHTLSADPIVIETDDPEVTVTHTVSVATLFLDLIEICKEIYMEDQAKLDRCRKQAAEMVFEAVKNLEEFKKDEKDT